jgi:hypothetical protein
MTREQFARLLLLSLDAPISLHNRRALQAQMQAEGGSAHFNPFNTTQDMPGATTFNSVGVKNYVSGKQGVEATAKTLQGKGHGYEAILRALRTNAPATETVTAIGASDWGTSATLALEVLDDIKHNRAPNTLAQLEKKEIAQ